MLVMPMTFEMQGITVREPRFQALGFFFVFNGLHSIARRESVQALCSGLFMGF